jgi:arabinofuranosyltransferase
MLAGAIWGAAQLAFLCDDAYIHFRYVANAHAGHGLVWNPPPFQPVEGMGFLWVMILWAIWSWFGIEPPAAANWFSIGCGVMQFVLIAAAAQRLCFRDGTRMPAAVGLCAVAAIAGNRTFLQWWTSGLDAALFNLWFLAWVLHAFRSPEQRRTTWLVVWSTFAALAALTRSEGLPLVCATLGTEALALVQGRARLRPTLVGLSPLLAVGAQVLWRFSYYGEWLPNTYYAKVVGAWPEAGLRYFACFLFENGAWLWFPLAAVWVVVELRRAGGSLLRTLSHHVPAVAAVAITLFNAGYFVFVVGGDHFEYRVLSQLVPLGVLGCAAMAARITDTVRLPIATVLSIGLASTVGWLHLALTHDMPFHGLKPITPQLPAVVRPLTRWFDRQQAWLFTRYIGARCTFHRNYLKVFATQFTHRIRIVDPPDPYPAMAVAAVGLPGWSLPDCVILDEMGLNDWVVARTPIAEHRPELTSEQLRPAALASDRDQDGFLDADELRAALDLALGAKATEDSNEIFHLLISICGCERSDAVTIDEAATMGDLLNRGRYMAHDRRPPPGYIEAFSPNVTVQNGAATVRPRQVPLTADAIRAIEAEWRERVRREYLAR